MAKNCWDFKSCGREQGGTKAAELGVCPAAAVGLNPYPGFNGNCFDCFNCIRFCPEDAIEPAKSMDDIAAYIRQRVRTINEQPDTQIFL